MTEPSHSLIDSAAYEQFMGQWSRAAGSVFLDWLSPPAGAIWLDVGCGTGAFTELVLDRCSPASVHAIDPVAAQIEHARGRLARRRAEFHVAAANTDIRDPEQPSHRCATPMWQDRR